jgi:hypothetical protein
VPLQSGPAESGTDMVIAADYPFLDMSMPDPPQR